MVVSRHAFMHCQCRQCIERPLVESVGVDHVVTTAPSAHRCAPVTSRGVVRGEIVRDGHHAVGHARQGPEECGHLPVHFLRDIGGFLEQLFGIVRIELRIGPQKFDELGKRAVEFHQLDDVVHFCPDPGNLPQPEIVDIVGGRVIEGGEEAGQVFVIRPPIFQRGCSERLAGSGDVLVGEESQVLPVGGHDGFGDGSGGLCPKPVRVFAADEFGDAQKRSEEYAVFRVVDDGAGDRRHDPVQNHPGLREPIREARAHVVDVLREKGSDCVQSRQIQLVFFRRPERHRLVHALNPDVESGIARERHPVRAVLRKVCPMAYHEFKQVVVCLVVRRQRVPVDRFQTIEELPIFFPRELQRSSCHVGQTVVVVGHPATAREQRIPLQAVTPFIREQLVEFGCRLLTDRHRRSVEERYRTDYASGQIRSIHHAILR